MKIVLDTNVLVSSLLNPDGSPAKILNLILSEKIILLYDNRILNEYYDVLKREKSTRQTNPIFTNQRNYAYLPGKMRL